MGWGELLQPRRPSELQQAIDDRAELARIVREYLVEMENPVPDYAYRVQLRRRLGDLIDYPYHPRG